MIKVDLFFSVVIFALWVFCLVDVIGTPPHRVRNLAKAAWVVIVLLFPLVGSILWLAVGRPESAPRRSAYEREAVGFPEYDRPGRMAATNPDDDAAFLAQVKARAEAQRKAYDLEKRRSVDPDPPPPTT